MSDENKTPGASTPAATQTPPPPTPAKEPAKEPVKESAKERLNEHLPPKLVEGLKAAGYDVAAKGARKDLVMAVKSYDEQNLWRVVTFDGQRPEIGFDGKWLNPPKKPEAKPAKA